MTATSSDYSWWTHWRPDWAQAHCVTLVSNSTAEGVLAALGATPSGTAGGVDEFYDRAVDAYDVSQAVIGATGLDGDWTLMVEVNGFVGVTERLMGPLSVGRTVVSHFRNVNAAYRFQWWRDGQLVVDFDPMFPVDSRYGADPDAVSDDVGAVGMAPDGDAGDIDCSAASFALAQRITGVVCTPALFERSEFVTATVTLPTLEEQQRYEEALQQDWRAPAVW